MLPRLDKLLHNCTVKILTDSGTCCGTGFFIAPRIVMTCGHAIKNKQEKDLVKIIAYEDNQEVNAQVKVLFPGGADIALLAVQPGFFSSSCVYLDTEIAPLDKCYAFGFIDSDGFPQGDPVGLECEGITGGIEPFIKLKMGQVRPGLSGSPLLNFRTGKVCGVMKFTRSRSTDLGGGATPLNIIFSEFPQLITLHQEFHQHDRRWISLINPDGDALSSDWSYIDDSAKRFKNYVKALLFLIKVLLKWTFLGWQASYVFPFSTLNVLVNCTIFKKDLGQEIKRQRAELTHRLEQDVQPDCTHKAKLLYELDSQAEVLAELIEILVDDQQDLSSISRLLWAKEIIYEQQAYIQELKQNEGNSYPEIERLSRKFFNSTGKKGRDKKYERSDRVVSRLVASHTKTNFIAVSFLNDLQEKFFQQINENPRLGLFMINFWSNFWVLNREIFPKTDFNLDNLINNLEREIDGNSDLKILRKFHILLLETVGERVEGGLYRAWNSKGKYHSSRKCKLYPERAKPDEMKLILSYETRENAEKSHQHCGYCRKVEIAVQNDDGDFIGEEPEIVE